jgi:multidrug efflux pump subunit AcrB
MANLVKWYLEKPQTLLAFLILMCVLGLIGLKEIPRKFFPDANRPQVAVVLVEPGASAEDLASTVTRPVEQHLKSLDLVRQVRSVTKEQVAVVTVEFEYEKSIDSAALDVSNEISKLLPELPKELLPPQVYKVTDATKPVMVISVRPKERSSLTLAQVRQICENQIKDALLNLKGVSNVEVFGGYKREVRIYPDFLELSKKGVTLNQLIRAIRESNENAPAGLLINKKGMVVIKVESRAKSLQEIAQITVKPGVKVKELAKIEWGYQERLSAYHGNGKPAIGISILRSPSGYELPTIEAVKSFLPELRKEFPNLEFEVTDTQEWLIKLSNKNMLEALRDAVIMTLIVVFLFLANVRTVLVAFISIPATYLITIAIMWLLGLNFNIVTLTGVILALGMLIDDAVVVLENIERHYFELKKEPKSATLDGTTEVMLAVLSGTYATVVMLLPLLFVGGYVEKILKPLALTLIIALVVSFVVSVTIIPIVAPKLLKRAPEKNFLEKRVYRLIVEGVVFKLREFYASLTEAFLKKTYLKLLAVLGAAFLFVFTLKSTIPVVGRDLMPPMDTGIVIVRAEADPDTSLEESEKILSQVEKLIYSMPGVVRVSSVVGSEPGVLSFGSGKLPQQIEIKVQFVDRFHREKSIWEIERELRDKISKVPGIRYFHVFDFGATPLSSINATVDEAITGAEPRVLDALGNKLEELMGKVKGLTTVSRSWYYDKTELTLKVDQEKASLFGITPLEVAKYLWSFVGGVTPSNFIIPNENGLAVRVILPQSERDYWEKLSTIPVPTSGFSARSTGTAWRCMFEPINARLASSCSRNGISAAAEPEIIRGEISIRFTLFASFNSMLPFSLVSIRSSTIIPSSLTSVEAGAIHLSSSCVAVM